MLGRGVTCSFRGSLSRLRFRSYSTGKYSFLSELGLVQADEGENLGCFNGSQWMGSGPAVESRSPIDGSLIGRVRHGSDSEVDSCLDSMKAAQDAWQRWPAPKRGEIVRQIGNRLREKLHPLGSLVALEMGKILAEGIGEVQEFIDMCDLAVGYSRQMQGQIVPSERKDTFLMEAFHPIGSVGIITAFNFPVAVFGWNAAVSLAAGNTHIWMGAPTTPMTTVAVQKIVNDVFEANGVPTGVATVVSGEGPKVGARLVEDPRLPLISFTGSTAVGREVARKVHSRFGKSILELGGNNCLVIMDDADVDLAIQTAFFGAVGTAGQRCTTTRRLAVHEKVYDEVVAKLKKIYATTRIGNPLQEGILMGPLHSRSAVKQFEEVVVEAQQQGGELLIGGQVLSEKDGVPAGGNYVQPTVVAVPNTQLGVCQKETFVPVMYVMKFSHLEDAIAINNGVPQGLSSSLFTRNMSNVFQWIGARGSETGLVNVNAPTSGAEIGLGFGGEKETGQGREAGSDSWKQYCRRITSTINYGAQMDLAQGIVFE